MECSTVLIRRLKANQFAKRKDYDNIFCIGSSPSGKAQDFDSCISLVQIQYSQPYEGIVQTVEQETFNLCVGSSNLSILTIIGM